MTTPFEELKERIEGKYPCLISMTGKYIRTEEHGRNISLALTGKPRSEECRRKISLGKKGKLASSGAKQHMSEAHKGKHLSEEHKHNVSLACMGRICTTEHRRNYSNARKRALQDPEFRSRAIKALLGGAAKRPNIPESKLLALLNYYCPNEYEYTGNGSVPINGLCPDFINCNGQRKVIEVFGSHWHKGEDSQDRVSAFTQLGYKCLVVWEYELVDGNYEQVISKIRTFNQQKAEQMIRGGGI